MASMAPDLITLLGGCLKIEGVGGGEHFLLETMAHQALYGR